MERSMRWGGILSLRHVRSSSEPTRATAVVAFRCDGLRRHSPATVPLWLGMGAPGRLSMAGR